MVRDVNGVPDFQTNDSIKLAREFAVKVYNKTFMLQSGGDE